jgi:hypothetical protein
MRARFNVESLISAVFSSRFSRKVTANKRLYWFGKFPFIPMPPGRLARAGGSAHLDAARRLPPWVAQRAKYALPRHICLNRCENGRLTVRFSLRPFTFTVAWPRKSRETLSIAVAFTTVER